MYCEPCRVERLGTARFCVICGSKLIERPREEVEADLARVRWLLEELVEWDKTSVAARAREYVIERYRKREKILLSALMHASAPEAAPAPSAPPPPVSFADAGPIPVEEPARFEPLPPAAPTPPMPPPPASFSSEPPPAPVPVPETAPAVLLEARAPELSVEDRVVAEASTWSRIWKPFLNESIGWFIGAFLIVAGTFYGVSSAWEGMSSTARALLVFALAGAWTLGFSAWAQFLWRRDATRGAARVLRLIGAAMAPLAPFAVGPVVNQSPVVAGVLVGVWAVIAAALALGVTRDIQHVGLRAVPAAMAACAAIMGLAPWIAPMHAGAVWLAVIPVGLLWLNARSGVATQDAQAKMFAFLAPLYLAVLFAARLHFAVGAEIRLATWAPFLALAFTAALELRAPVGPDGRPRWERAADPVSVLVAAGQLGLMAWAVLGAAPAFFLTSLVGAHTAWRMLKGTTSPLAPRWIYPLYFFSYFAFQTCGQLVPGWLTQLLAQLKEALHYPPAQALPFAYNAVYAAVFVIAGAVLAVRWLKARPTWADALLRCTWITSVLTVLLAVSSLGSDPLPAMISVPLLLALSLGLGLYFDRPVFTRVAAGTAVAWALTLAVWAGAPSAALPVALVAVLLAALAVFFTAPHREPLSIAGYLLVSAAVALAWVLPGNGSQVVALGLAFAAAWLIGRNLDLALAQEAAWFIPAIAVARAMVLWQPEYAPLALAATAVVLAAFARSKGRLGFAEPASALAAVLAPGWQWVWQQQHGEGPALGLVCVVSAFALAFGARRTGTQQTAGWRDAVALFFGAAALLPIEMWRGWSPLSAAVGYALLGAGATGWAASFGRRWRPAWLASLAIAGAVFVAIFAEDKSAQPELVCAVLAVGVLATVRALLPSISVPIAACFALRAADGQPNALLGIAVGLSVIALFEEWDLTWTHVLGKARVAWAASLSAFCVLGGLGLFAAFSTTFHQGFTPAHWAVAAALPLLWVRGTRWGILAFAVPPLVLCATAIPGTNFESTLLHAVNAPWLTAAVLFALTHAVERVGPLRQVLFGAATAERVKRQFSPWLLAGATATGAALLPDGGSGLPWALLLVFAAGELVGLRWMAAGCFAVATEGMPPLFAMGLLVLAFGEKLAPGLVSRVLGAKPSKTTVPAAVLTAIALAGFAEVTAGPGQVVPMAWLLGAAFCAGALLLNIRWLWAVGVVAAALPVTLLGADLLVRGAWIAAGAAALAAVLRFESLQQKLRQGLAKLNLGVAGDYGGPFWFGAAVTVGVLLTFERGQPELVVPLLATAALLLFTPTPWEIGGAAALAAGTLYLVVGIPAGAAILGGAGFTLCLLGMLLKGLHPAAKAWHHAGWAMSLVALMGGSSLHHPATAIAWAFAAGCAVVVAHEHPAFEWVRWVGLAAGAHVGLFYLGLKLSTGAPRELILPWVATASLVLAAIAIKMGKSVGRVGQRFGSAWVLLTLGMLELGAGLVLLGQIHGRESAVAAVGVAVALWALAGRITEDDDPISAVFAGLLLPLGFVAIRRLTFGAGPDAVETIAALVAGAGIGGLAKWLEEGGAKRVARVARSFGFWWPLAGLVAAPWNTPWTVCLLLLAQSVHFAVIARGEAFRRRAALLSTLAFNGAMVAAFAGAHAESAEYLLIPFGLSLLMLLKAFEGDLAEGTRVKLRAAAVTLVYGAAAFRPLTFSTTGALWVCVALCVVGVGLGIVLKVRSYVYLGTAFMVTTIVANLVRYGVREPKMGALFLSGLGLAVVGFMVLVTTRRSELVARYQSAKSLLQNWEG